MDAKKKVSVFEQAFPNGVVLSDENIKFFSRLAKKSQAITFNEVILEDKPSDHHPNDVNLNSFITRNIRLKSGGIISAAMDTVTDKKLALELAKLGGVGIIHRNISIKDQARMISWIRKKIHYGGMVENPVTFRPNQFASDIQHLQEKNHYQFTSFPIVDENNILLGLITRDELGFIEDFNPELHSIMKPLESIVTTKVGTTSQEAYQLMRLRKVKKLPIVDSDGHLMGMYVWNDVKTDAEKQNLFSLDSDGHFLVGAAIGLEKNEMERVRVLVEAGCKLFVLDSSHGGCKSSKDQIRNLRMEYGDSIDIIVGNIASYESAKYLLDSVYLPDALKVGIGPGSICTTRIVTGHGVPQLTAVNQVLRAINESGKYMPIIADGGIRNSGDIVKIYAAGASAVMLGSMLAGTTESPGAIIIKEGKKFKKIRGMGSKSAMEERIGSRSRYYCQAGRDDVSERITIKQQEKITPEGIEGLVEYVGPLSKLINQITGGIQSGLAHSGASSIKEFQQKAKFWIQSQSGVQEGNPHDVFHITQ